MVLLQRILGSDKKFPENKVQNRKSRRDTLENKVSQWHSNEQEKILDDKAKFEARTDIEAVVIATSTPIRLDLIEICAQRDWPFYAEKPLAWRVSQAQAIHDAGAPVAERSMVGFMMRYHPAVRDLAARDRIMGRERVQLLLRRQECHFRPLLPPRVWPWRFLFNGGERRARADGRKL